MANVSDSEEFDPSAQRRERKFTYYRGHPYSSDNEKVEGHMVRSSAAQLAICLAANGSDSTPDLLEERLKGKEVGLDDNIAEVLTEAELAFLPSASYILDGLHEVSRIQGRWAYDGAKNAIAVDRMGIHRIP